MHSFSINYLKYVFWWNSVFKFLVLIRLCKEASLIKRFASHHFCETNYSKISYSETDFLRNFFLGFSLLTCGIKQRRYLSMAHTDVNPYQKTTNHCSSWSFGAWEWETDGWSNCPCSTHCTVCSSPATLTLDSRGLSECFIVVLKS